MVNAIRASAAMAALPSMIGLCQGAKIPLSALGRSADVNSFLIPSPLCWPLSRGSFFSEEPDFHILAQPFRAAQKIELVISCQSRN